VTRRGWLLFSTLSLVWGVPYLFIKIAVEQLSPAVVVGLRVALAAAVLLPVAALREQLAPLLVRWRWVLGFAVVELTVPWGLLGFAEQRISSGRTGLLVAAVPLMGALLAWALRLDDRVDGRRFAGLLVGVGGVAALVGIDVRGGDLLAVGAVLVTAFCYALGPIIVAARLAGLPSLAVVAVSLGVNAVLYAPFAWLTRPTGPDGDVAALAAVPASAWWSIVVLGLLCSAIAFLVFFALVAEVGPARTTVITYVNPAVAVTLGVAVLDEPVTAGILLGFPLVLLGSWLATRRSRTDAAPNIRAY
jgi:drug/metabolite transporter (DMT)-like permease